MQQSPMMQRCRRHNWGNPLTERLHVPVRLVLLLLLLLCARCSRAQNIFYEEAMLVQNAQGTANTQQETYALQVSEFVDLQNCWNYLNASDLNHNGIVTNQEYIIFAQLMSPPGLLAGVSVFDQLPLEFLAAFSYTACLCMASRFGGNASSPECCFGDQAYLRVPVSPSDHPSATDLAYLAAACSFTSSAVQADLEQHSPSPNVLASPIPAPVASTSRPTLATVAPSTKAPTTLLPTTTSSSSVRTTPIPTPNLQTMTSPPMTIMSTTTSAPTVSSSLSSSSSATGSGVVFQARVTYRIRVTNGQTEISNNPKFVLQYQLDLIRAMNILAPQVAQERFSSSTTSVGVNTSATLSTNSLTASTVAGEGTTEASSSPSARRLRGILRISRVNGDSSRQRNLRGNPRRRRRLGLTVQLPTSMGPLVDVGKLVSRFCNGRLVWWTV